MRRTFMGFLDALASMKDSRDAKTVLAMANELLKALDIQERAFRATLLFEVGSAIALNDVFQLDLREQALDMLREAAVLRESGSPPLERSLILMAIAKALPRENRKEAIEGLRLAVELLKTLPEQLDYGVAVQSLSLRLADGGSDEEVEQAMHLAQESISVLNSNGNPCGAVVSMRIVGQIALLMYDQGRLDSLMIPFEYQMEAMKACGKQDSNELDSVNNLASSIVDVAEVCLTGLQSLIEDWNVNAGPDLTSRIDWSKNPAQLDQEVDTALSIFRYLKSHPANAGLLLTTDPELRPRLDNLIDELLVTAQRLDQLHPLGYRTPNLTPGLSIRLTRR